MTNLDGWWAQSSKRYSIGWSGFSNRRWSLTNWCNQTGQRWPTSSVREIRSTGWPNCRFRLWFNCKLKVMHHYLHRWQLVSIRRLLIVSPEGCQYRKWIIDQAVVIWGEVPGKPGNTNTFSLACPMQHPIHHCVSNQTLLKPSACTPAYGVPNWSLYRNRIWTKTWWRVLCHLRTEQDNC